MNQVLDLLNSHASVRQFTGEPINVEQEREILRAARRAPTSSNLHAYSIISVRESKSKEELAELAGGQKHVVDCELFLVFCADLRKLERLAEKKSYKYNGDTTEAFIVATVDASLAGCRALIAAQAMGFGGVMVGGIRNHPEDVCNLLALPRLVYPVFGMSLGKPVKPPRAKPRMPFDGLVFSERYDESLLDAAIDQYDETINDVGYLKGREVEPEGYPDFSDLYSWSEHSARRMASKNPGVLRGHMTEFLNGRGLLLK